MQLKEFGPGSGCPWNAGTTCMHGVHAQNRKIKACLESQGKYVTIINKIDQPVGKKNAHCASEVVYKTVILYQEPNFIPINNPSSTADSWIQFRCSNKNRFCFCEWKLGLFNRKWISYPFQPTTLFRKLHELSNPWIFGRSSSSSTFVLLKENSWRVKEVQEPWRAEKRDMLVLCSRVRSIFCCKAGTTFTFLEGLTWVIMKAPACLDYCR